MTTTIGRAVFTNAPSQLAWDGDTLTVNITINPATLDQAKVLRQQVLGLANNADEPVVPFTSTDDPDLDGFYVVEGVNVDPIRTYLTSKLIRCGIGLRRVAGGYSFPQQEMITGALTRTNAHGLTGDALAAVVPNVTNAIRSSTAWVVNLFTRSVSDGATAMQIFSATPTLAPFAFSWWTPPALHYYGSARIEVNIGGAWYLVVGRQIPLSDFWRISNGMIRLTSGDGATVGTLEVWTGSAWESRNIRHFDVTGAAGANIGLAYDTDRSPVTIIRNSPEKVVVRCATNALVVDYSVQRGHRHVEFGFTGAGSQRGVGLDSSHAAACTAITGGIRQTANDANGNQIVFGMAGGTLVTNLVSGSIYSSSTPPYAIMAGVALDGSTAVVRDQPADLMNQFIGVAPVTQRVVMR